ncbi:4,5-DOPA dioxygenase extradiol [Yersinia ruckeri]|uniref:4,5-DOPA-extradiol-dioxygenase n=1 Tax=Yersinia ruckeri TaxID=29486 RepID=UPI0011A77491|nr:4,5-DOPA dioxygenase extradiol [Yersinia ruckeri]EKN3345938.1 4,5-DOPA dioxygenase extradiol [Yersinia ruckeri]EKN3363212.1 4,5-DOPA dioxygenase extradiol [Yersinia ruckeri]EKN4202946.1 4,5-DOPA dioxygenase extradiol [Yersinia ruckeri]EKN4208960.1 4,5-DOPA dioxygenase extradiol [Yersinia ruckeri]EKN4699465.1 4,5-DOPA dioxygenase extradiol [Yersinia ruckeri]
MNTSRMPALFLGHGSPMNVLEENSYTLAWRELGKAIPHPKAILAISAHWYTRGTVITAMEKPRTIHDFGGFPQALFDTQYPAPGSPALAARVQMLLQSADVMADTHEWGLDHGTWGVLIKMYPDADIPVVQLSIDGTKPAAYHYELGRKLAALREEGVLIVASGNVVHNLGMVNWKDEALPYPWAESFQQFVRDNLDYQGDNHPLVNFMDHDGAALSNPTPEHFLPLLYILASWDGKEAISLPTEGIEMGSLSMLSVRLG